MGHAAEITVVERRVVLSERVRPREDLGQVLGDKRGRIGTLNILVRYTLPVSNARSNMLTALNYGMATHYVTLCGILRIY